MQDYAFDAIVFIHRSQPFHKAHKKIYDRALALGKVIIPVFGSDRKAPSTYNPWTTQERIAMVKSCFDEEDLARVHFTAVCDHPYKNAMWLAEVHTKVREVIDKVYQQHVEWSDYDSSCPKNPKIGIIGYKKDDTSDYLDWFPQWEFIDTASFIKGVSATDIRTSYFREMVHISYEPKYAKFLSSKTFKEVFETNVINWSESVPEPVAKYLELFKTLHPERCQSLASEFLSNLVKKEDKKNYRFPITEQTADAVVIKNGHVLLVRRGLDPGKGQWALPGGYIKEFEEIFDASLRELAEETSINFFHNAAVNKQDQFKKTKQELIKCYVGDHVFAHPKRSTRGRVITSAFHFELPDGGEFPHVKAADDAAAVKWWPVADIYYLREKLFEDHGDIIEFFAFQPTKKWNR